MNTKPQYAPGPYQTQDVGCQTSFHAYVVDANGRKIGVAWGPVGEKVWTQALFAASLDLLTVCKKISDRCEAGEASADILGHHIIELNAAIAKVEGGDDAVFDQRPLSDQQKDRLLETGKKHGWKSS